MVGTADEKANRDEFSEAAEKGIDVSQWGVQATPQTVSRLTPDPIIRLASSPGIGQSEILAAWEIRAVFTALTSHMGFARLQLDGLPKNQSRHRSERNIKGLNRYNSWADAMNARSWPLGPVLDVIAEGDSIRKVAKRRKRDHNALERLVKESLGLYAEVSGWPRSQAA